MTTGGPTAELEVEAMRVLPALAKARLQGDLPAAAELLRGYHDDVARLGLSAEAGWRVFAIAGVKWLTRMMLREATADDTDALSTADAAIVAAAEWAAHRDH